MRTFRWAVATALVGKIAPGALRERGQREGRGPAATSPPESPAKTHRAEALNLTARHSGIRAACMCLPLLPGLAGCVEGRNVFGP